MSQFFEALRSSDLSKVTSLLERQPELIEQISGSEVLQALFNGQNQLANLLVQAGAKLDFFTASATGQLEQTRILLQAGQDVNQFSSDGFTALQLACFFAHPETSQYLLTQGANPSAVSTGFLKTTPLLASLASNNPEFMLELLKYGADVHERGDSDFTPLHSAAFHNNPEIIQALLDHGADKNALNKDGKTAFELAREKAFLKTMKLLEPKGLVQ